MLGGAPCPIRFVMNFSAPYELFVGTSNWNESKNFRVCFSKPFSDFDGIATIN